MFKKKSKVEKAILIEKKIVTVTSKTNEVRNLYRMSRGIYDCLPESKKKPSKQEYYFIFMSKRGRQTYLIDPSIYHKYKIDSLGNLERQGSKLVSFKFIKKATKHDVEDLKW